MSYTTYKVRIHQDGMKEWFVGGKHHRIDGPAIEDKDGSKEWWLNGKLHRIDGPAIENSDGSQFWFVDGKRYSQVDFEAKVKTLVDDPCDGKVVEIDGKKYRLSSIA